MKNSTSNIRFSVQNWFARLALGALLAAVLPSACSASQGSTDRRATDTGAAGKPSADKQDAGSIGTAGGANLYVDATAPSELDCASAANSRSYLGCDFWPTVTRNGVWSIFDFAVVVVNVGDQPADVKVEGANGIVASATVAARSLVKLYLPWVPELKGSDPTSCGTVVGASTSAFVKKGAYHLTSTKPVIVNQFSALQFRGAGGPSGKDWSQCPGLQKCSETGAVHGCFSFSNDAAILLPSTALTGNYRVTTLPAGNSQAFFAITATRDATSVVVKLGPNASVLPGAGLPSGTPGKPMQFTMNAGDVVQIMGASESADPSGSLVQADKPVQVMAGSGCAALPQKAPTGENATCDHLEESVLPAESLGKRYIVMQPTGVLGKPTPHMVRIYGNVDGTTLKYSAGAPAGAPTSLNAGQTADLGIVNTDFEVTADHEISVGTFLLSAVYADPEDIISRGDPSQSQAVTVDQFRTDYVFLAPDDYDVNYLDIIMPLDAEVVIDNQLLPSKPVPIGATEFGVARVRLGSGDQGAHTLTSNKPVGLQVLGYGSYTSYQYPGGLDLKPIAPAPPK